MPSDSQPGGHDSKYQYSAAPSSEESGIGNWYLRSRHRFVARLASKVLKRSGGTSVLDAGCGTGGLCAFLEAEGVTTIVGCDAESEAVAHGREKGRLKNAIVADVSKLPFDDNAFDLVICSEVLEHLPDHRAGLREILRVSRGPVLLTIPAHPCLWTESDEILHHQRRYTRAMLRELLSSCDATVERVAPFGAIPGLMILLFKLLKPSSGKAGGDQKPLAARMKWPGWLDALLYRASNAELALSSAGCMPWGHAWWVLLRK
jgi:SAM-dependent methyltransferase